MASPIRQEFFNAKDDPSVNIYTRTMDNVKAKCLRALQCENLDEAERHLEHIEWDFATLEIEFAYILTNYQKAIDEYNKVIDLLDSVEVE